MTRPEIELNACIATLGRTAVAVSGGVDSLTLASACHRRLGTEALMVHAVSPAVPVPATRRVRDLAAREGWRLQIVEAGEFADPRYRANPVDRCFFCKTNLYATIRAVAGAAADRQVVSGANLDDLGEYRPGLDAAREHGVRHPFVEAGLDKAAVRALARDLGLGGIAELPSAPCLSSRVETGIRIEPETLAFVHAAEAMVDGALGPGDARRSVRCRVRASGIVIELDPHSLAALDGEVRTDLAGRIAAHAPVGLRLGPVLFQPYRNGSAFLTGRSEARA